MRTTAATALNWRNLEFCAICGDELTGSAAGYCRQCCERPARAVKGKQRREGRTMRRVLSGAGR